MAFDRYVGYGKFKPNDKNVQSYCRKVMKDNDNDPYKSCDKVNNYISKVESKEKRQFLNAVCDGFQKFFS